MQAVDELRSRHAQQQAVDSSQLQVEVGLGPPPNITFSPPTDTTVGGQVAVAVGIRVGIDVQAPLASGSVAEVNRSDGMNLASESLGHACGKGALVPRSRRSKVAQVLIEPTGPGVEWNQGAVGTTRPPMQVYSASELATRGPGAENPPGRRDRV